MAKEAAKPMIEKGNSKLSPKDKTLIQMTKEVS